MQENKNQRQQEEDMQSRNQQEDMQSRNQQEDMQSRKQQEDMQSRNQQGDMQSRKQQDSKNTDAEQRAREKQLEEYRKQQRMAKTMRHGPGRNQVAEKPKNFKGSFGKLMCYIGRYRLAVILVMIFAVLSTIFSVLGPKIMGHATTELAEGLMRKIQGTGGIDFEKIGKILIFTLGLYLASAGFSFI